MRKIICIIAIILGVAIIGGGVYLQLSSAEPKKEEKKGTMNQEDSFERVNTYKKNEVCTTYKLVDTYVNTNNYTKINFSYPDCVHEYSLSFWYKNLKSADEVISIDIRKDTEKLNNYMSEKETQLIGLAAEEEYHNAVRTGIHYTTNKEGKKVGILEANYQYYFITTTSYDVWYIGIELNEDFILTIEIKVKDAVFSYEAVKEMIDSIKVEEEKAVYKNSTIEGEKQIGTIRLNKNKEYEHGFKLTYDVPVKYPEVDSLSSDYDESVFEFENINEKFYTNISLEHDSFYKTFDEKVEKFKPIAGSSYQNSETYRNVKDSGILTKTISGKQIKYFIYSYDYFTEEAKTKSYTGYLSYAYYEIEPNYYYIIYISTKNIVINEAVISEFLNIKIAEY